MCMPLCSPFVTFTSTEYVQNLLTDITVCNYSQHYFCKIVVTCLENNLNLHGIHEAYSLHILTFTFILPSSFIRVSFCKFSSVLQCYFQVLISKQHLHLIG